MIPNLYGKSGPEGTNIFTLHATKKIKGLIPNLYGKIDREHTYTYYLGKMTTFSAEFIRDQNQDEIVFEVADFESEVKIFKCVDSKVFLSLTKYKKGQKIQSEAYLMI